MTSLNCSSTKSEKDVLKELEAALLALPRKRLIGGAFCDGGDVCALGAMSVKRQVEAGETIEKAIENAFDYINRDSGYTKMDRAANTFGISFEMACEIAKANDGDDVSKNLSPEERYGRMLAWIRDRIRSSKY